MFQELDFQEILNSKEDRQAKIAQLRKQCEQEIELINQKYESVLAEYEPAIEKLKQIIQEHNEKWDPLMEDYAKETAELKKRYNRMLKAL